MTYILEQYARIVFYRIRRMNVQGLRMARITRMIEAKEQTTE